VAWPLAARAQQPAMPVRIPQQHIGRPSRLPQPLRLLVNPNNKNAEAITGD
jgi:hypothetical protein